MGPGKVEAMREVAEQDGIDLEGSYAYTDSFTDMPMLELVGNPVVVNPDRELREAAEENDWPILEFQRPVSLERKIQPPPKRVWIPVAAGVAVVVVAAALSKTRDKRHKT
jgi:hypothetical protein